MSCNIISKILSTAQNLQEVFGLWVYTLIIVSRIRKLSDLNLSKTQVNFNDVISL